jgi:hypothetical protein
VHPPTRVTCAAAVLALVVETGTVVFALGAAVPELRAAGQTVRASFEIRDAFTDTYRKVLERGSALHLRIEAEFWEDRPAWDRLVRPAFVSVFRILRDPSGPRITVTDAFGTVVSYPDYPQPLIVQVDVSPTDRISDQARYYLDAVTTIGTIAEREVEEAGEAVFGRDQGGLSIGRVGRFFLEAVLQITDYIQSTSARARSRPFSGREIRGQGD